MRRGRYENHRVVDPDRRYQKDYEPLLRAPQDVQKWPPRPPYLPVLVNGHWSGEGEPDLGVPVLSAIVISRDDETRIERAVGSVVAQRLPQAFEVSVVTSGRQRAAQS